MYRTCLFCTEDLGENVECEWLPVGRRIAFDESKGRLWVVCPKCAKWNLVPFDNRLEAIEVCERLFRGTKTRYATDEIGMAKLASGLTLIRVGRPVGEEFAGWRYGESFRRRRRRTQIAGVAAGGAMLALFSAHKIFGLIEGQSVSKVLFGSGSGYYMMHNYFKWGKGWSRKFATRLKARNPLTGKRVTLKAGVVESAMIEYRQEPVLTVEQSSGDMVWMGEEAEAMTGRVLAKINAADGSAAELNTAVAMASDLASKRINDSLLLSISTLFPRKAKTWRLKDASAGQRLALEMYFNEDAERRVLEGELAFLERQWRDADALASVSDTLALPEDAAVEFERLRREES